MCKACTLSITREIIHFYGMTKIKDWLYQVLTWQGYGRTRNLMDSWLEYKMVQTLWKTA